MTNARPSRAWIASLLLPVVALSARAASADDPGVTGDWYVLIHYRDLRAEDTEQLHWDDELWRIEARPDGLRWTLHPHVSLRDTSGRAEKLPSGAEARTPGAWSPNAAQLDEIRGALVPDPHEVRSRTLRGSPATGFRSAGAARAASASSIGYSEAWSITLGDGGLPEWQRQEALEAARAEGTTGTTRFTATSRSASGDELSGEYERDGEWLGTFRLLRIRIAGAGARE